MAGALIDGLLQRVGDGGESLDVERRRLLLAAVSRGGATRKRLAPLFDLRLATVSRHIAELKDAGLVKDEYALAGPGRGRPEVALACVTDAIVCIVIRVVSDTFVGAVVDLGGNVLEEVVRPVDASSIDADGIEQVIVEMVENLRRIAPAAELSGLSLSLPGIIEGGEKRWFFSGRFPNAASVVLGNLQDRLGMEVIAHRPLNAELRARLMSHPEERQGSVVLLHWGFGISLSYAVEGQIINPDHSAFGEIGHWQVDSANGLLCRCGRRGCLETKAALWSLGEQLGITDTAEDAFGHVLRAKSTLASHPLITEASQAMARAVSDIYLLLFPRRLIISGPFVQSKIVLNRVKRLFQSSLPSHVPQNVSLVATARSAADEILGASRPLLQKALHARLDSLTPRSNA